MTNSYPNECCVVMYHYVRARGAPMDRGVRGLSPAGFESQLDALLGWGEPLSWEVFAAGRDRPTSMPRRSFLLTFDDGLLDHLEVVAPILGERKLRGVFFVPGRLLCEPRMLAAHQVHLLLSARAPEDLLEDVMTEVARLSPQTRFSEAGFERDAAMMYAYETPARARLKHLLTQVLPISLKNHVLTDLFARHVGDAEGWSRRWYLSPRQVVELQSAGHTIGGHGYAHEPLSRLAPADLEFDVTRCAQALNDLLGPAPRPFSYPFGSFNDAAVEAVRAARFSGGVTTLPRLARPQDTALLIPRIDTIHVASHLTGDRACRV